MTADTRSSATRLADELRELETRLQKAEETLPPRWTSSQSDPVAIALALAITNARIMLAHARWHQNEIRHMHL